MRARDRAFWALAVILSIAQLIAPALWNGSPQDRYGALAAFVVMLAVLARKTARNETPGLPH